MKKSVGWNLAASKSRVGNDIFKARYFFIEARSSAAGYDFMPPLILDLVIDSNLWIFVLGSIALFFRRGCVFCLKNSHS
jgi:hypothetical protein